ncbi:MAG: hypothetical protein ACOY16_11745 [Chloroflexota bacterium]
MKRLKIYINLDTILGGICLLALGFCHLALTDIYHGDENVALEWNIVRITILLFTLFVVTTFWTLHQVNKTLAG